MSIATVQRPWVMISVNDDKEDLHFRKAGDSSEISGSAQSTGSKQALIGGIAYGGYARKIVGRVLRKLPTQHGQVKIEDYPEYFLEAFQEASALVGPVKSYSMPSVLPEQM